LTTTPLRVASTCGGVSPRRDGLTSHLAPRTLHPAPHSLPLSIGLRRRREASTVCIISLADGQLALSAYFLALSCVMPGYVAKALRRRRL